VPSNASTHQPHPENQTPKRERKAAHPGRLSTAHTRPVNLEVEHTLRSLQVKVQHVAAPKNSKYFPGFHPNNLDVSQVTHTNRASCVTATVTLVNTLVTLLVTLVSRDRSADLKDQGSQQCKMSSSNAEAAALQHDEPWWVTGSTNSTVTGSTDSTATSSSTGCTTSTCSTSPGFLQPLDVFGQQSKGSDCGSPQLLQQLLQVTCGCESPVGASSYQPVRRGLRHTHEPWVRPPVKKAYVDGNNTLQPH
jgi:hypothetical protein